MRRARKWLLILVALGLCGVSVWAYGWVRQYQAMADEEPEITLSPDLADFTYCTIDDVALKMDLHYPAHPGAPSPVLVYVHGGSFVSGDKRKGSGVIDIPAMTDRGYAVAAINYRLMPENPFPSAVIDAKCAIRSLRAHAAELQLDADEIGVWGGSAGGHVVAMLSLTNGDPAFENGEYLDQSSSVDAVVEMFGPTDLTGSMGWLQSWIRHRAFGTDDPAAPSLVHASPVNYVSSAAPPFLIFHGDQDDAVPVVHAQALHQQLVEAGADSTLVIVINANHNFKPTGGPIEPARSEISAMMVDFFDRWLP